MAGREEPEVRFLGDVQRLTLQPGDVLVLKCANVLTVETTARLREHVQKIVGQECKVMVLSGGLEIGVLSPQAETA